MAMSCRTVMWALWPPRSWRHWRMSRLTRSDRTGAPRFPGNSPFVLMFNDCSHLPHLICTPFLSRCRTTITADICLIAIFNPSPPVHESAVLDDPSSDDSLQVIPRIADEWDREIRVMENSANSGSVFSQWRNAAEAATGEYLWIAE